MGGIRQNDLKPCAVCGRGMMPANQVHFYRVTVEQLVIDLRAVQRQHGLEMMLGAAAGLAQALGPDEDLAVGMGEHVALICADCALPSEIIAAVAFTENDAVTFRDTGGRAL